MGQVINDIELIIISASATIDVEEPSLEGLSIFRKSCFHLR